MSESVDCPLHRSNHVSNIPLKLPLLSEQYTNECDNSPKAQATMPLLPTTPVAPKEALVVQTHASQPELKPTEIKQMEKEDF